MCDNAIRCAACCGLAAKGMDAGSPNHLCAMCTICMKGKRAIHECVVYSESNKSFDAFSMVFVRNIRPITKDKKKFEGYFRAPISTRSVPSEGNAPASRRTTVLSHSAVGPVGDVLSRVNYSQVNGMYVLRN